MTRGRKEAVGTHWKLLRVAAAVICAGCATWSEVEALKQDAAALEASVRESERDLSKKLVELERQVTTLNVRVDSQQRDIERLEAEAHPARAEIARLREHSAALEQSVTRLLETSRRLQDALAQSDARIERHEESVAGELEALKRSFDSLATQLKVIGDAVGAVETATKQAVTKLGEQMAKLAREMEANDRHLNAEIERLRNEFQAKLKEVKEQCAEGGAEAKMATVLDYLDKLIWPAIALLAILLFRKPIARFVRNLKTVTTPFGTFESGASDLSSFGVDTPGGLKDDEAQWWVGRWQGHWSYEAGSGVYKNYASDMIDITAVNAETGEITAATTSAFGSNYDLTGKVAKDVASCSYRGKGVRKNLRGTMLLRRVEHRLTAVWSGVRLDNTLIGGKGVMTRLGANDEPVIEYYVDSP